MNTGPSLIDCLSDEAVRRLEDACCRFEHAMQVGQRPGLEEFLDGADGSERVVLLRELLHLEVFYRRQSGEVPAIDDYQTRFPDATAVLCQVLATDFEGPARLPGIHETTDDAQQTGPHRMASEDASHDEPANAPPGIPSVSRYRLLRFHAQGGLGEVHVAEDTELNREVALKQLKPQYAAHPDSCGRFVLEGEVTGSLEHPGIVPVYGLGTHADGRPFYAMRFIRGETFGEAIRAFHGRVPVRFDALEFRQLMGRFVAVCQALAYAHSRGVLHRDIKPGNIMLGPFGETLVVDWGLAKVMGSKETTAEAPGAERWIQTLGSSSPTTMGAVGTPAYMSPEQAAGKAAQVGPATDVYSLGATLYDLLTGRAPFQGNVFEVLSKVKQGSWVAPRQVSGAVPAALDAICCKAMSLQPEDRYGSTLELAREVEQWLADEPVAAHREPLGMRMRRWARKHPSRVTGVLVLLAAAVVGLTVGTILLDRSKREAEESYRMAKEGVNHFLREVGEEVMLDEPGMEGLRRNLLNEALKYHEEFLKKRPNDPEVQQQLAETFRLQGELDGEFGRMEEGKARVLRAVALFENLLRQKPGDTDLRVGLARTLMALSELQVKSWEPEAGMDTINSSSDMLSTLRTEEPGNTVVLALMAKSLDLRATSKALHGDLTGAVLDNQEAVTTLKRSLYITMSTSNKTRPVRTRYPELEFEGRSNFRLLAYALNNQGMLLEKNGRTPESARVFQDAAALFGWISKHQPRAGRLRNGLALALLEAGHAEAALGCPQRGEPKLQQALELLSRLREDDPLIPEYKGNLMRAKGYLGENFFVRGRTIAATNLLREAVQLGDDLLKGQRRDRRLQTDHARFLYLLGSLQGELGQVDEALRSCTQAGEEQEQALATAPSDRSLRSERLRTREAISGLRFLKGKIPPDDRIRDFRQIHREHQDLAEGDLSSLRLRNEVGRSAAVLSGLLLEAGKAKEALEVLEQARPAHEALLRADRDRWNDERKRTTAPVEPDPVLNRQLDNTSQGGLFSEQFSFASSGQTPVVPVSFEFRRQWAELLARKGEALAAIHQGEASGKVLSQAIALGEELSPRGSRVFCPPPSWPSLWSVVAQELYLQDSEPCHLYDLACHLALASSLPDAAGISDPARRAVRALEDLVASGFDNGPKIRSDKKLDPLRSRKDFQKLIQDLQVSLREKSGVPPQR